MNKHKPKKIKNSVSGTVFDVFNVLFFLFFCITVVFPIWDMVVKALSVPTDISYLSLNLWPKRIVMQAFEYCIRKPLFLNAYVVTVSRAVAGTLYHLFIVLIGAYVLTRAEMPGIKFITFVWLIPMFFSAGLIPTFVYYKSLGIYNTFAVYVIPTAFSMYVIIIIRNFFQSIDKGLEESALVEGANPIKVLISIYLPLSKPVLATVTLWHMVGQWTAWFDNLAFVSNENLTTLQFLLRRVRIEAEQFTQDATSVMSIQRSAAAYIDSTSIMAATTLLIVIPIICIYPFLQKYFVKGVMLGAVKG